MTETTFMFTVGYQGDAALVDKGMEARFGKASDDKLFSEGLFKPAFCRGLFRGDQSLMEKVLEAYNKATSTKYKTTEELKRAFGVNQVPPGINRTIYL